MAPSDLSPSPERLLRVTMYVNRKPGMSVDEFHKHWTEQHAPLVKDWLARHGIVEYTQYHTPQYLRKDIPESFKNMDSLDYDGAVEMTVPTLDCILRSREDPYYKDVVMHDENSFFTWSQAKWTIGWVERYIVDGKVV